MIGSVSGNSGSEGEGHNNEGTGEEELVSTPKAMAASTSMGKNSSFIRSTRQITKFDENLLQILKVLDVHDIPKPLSTSIPVPSTKSSKLVEIAKDIFVAINQ